MNNEPVAFVTGVRQFDPVMADTVLKVGTPLYIHPAKTLTDAEIEEIAEQYKDVDYTLLDEEPFDVFDHRGFARAILRKAQEK